MRIGILGSGYVGKALAYGFRKESHEVMLATRNPNAEAARRLSQEVGAPVRSYGDTARWAELAVICTPWIVATDVIRLARPESLRGKTVIDTTNPFIFHRDKAPEWQIGPNTSAGEIIQFLLPDSNIVKAFNTTSSNFMYQPQFDEGAPSMFICGDDAGAKQTVHGILESFGWQPADAGGIESAREIESLAALLIKSGHTRQTIKVAVKLIHE